MAAQADLAAVRLQRAGNQVERRRLARAVRTDQADDLALVDAHGEIADRGEAAEGLGQAVDLDERALGRSLRALMRTKRHQRPQASPLPTVGKADDPVGQEIDDDDEDDAQHDVEMVGEIDGDRLQQDGQRHHAEERPVEAPGAAQERHDDHLEGEHRIEGERRVDIGVARRHDRAGGRHEGGTDGEQHQLGGGGVDGDVAGDGLVIADDVERQPQARTAGEPADQEDQDGQRQQLPEDLLRADVEEDVAAHRVRDLDLVPGDDLADELRQAEGEDDEEDAAQAQRRQSDDQRDRDADERCDGDDRVKRQRVGEHRHGVGADAEEGGGGQRDVARRAGEHRPRRGQQHELHHVDAEGQVVAVGEERKDRQEDDRDGQRR